MSVAVVRYLIVGFPGVGKAYYFTCAKYSTQAKQTGSIRGFKTTGINKALKLIIRECKRSNI